jgi:rare lipoprotein A
MRAMTAASWSYPLGTRVRVTAGGQSVVVTVTDRGPARRLHRVIDLSKASFARLAPTRQGIIKRVCVESLRS